VKSKLLISSTIRVKCHRLFCVGHPIAILNSCHKLVNRVTCSERALVLLTQLVSYSFRSQWLSNLSSLQPSHDKGMLRLCCKLHAANLVTNDVVGM